MVKPVKPIPQKIPRSVSNAQTRGAAARGAPNTGTMGAARRVSPDKPLTERQLAFAREYAKGNSISVSMARAGFSVAQQSLGYRMIKMPNVMAVVEAERKRYEEASQMSRKKVMDMLIESYEMAKMMAEPATMVSAAREVGKMCGYYEPRKVEISVTAAAATGRMNALTDEELLKIIEGGGAHALLEGPQNDSGD